MPQTIVSAQCRKLLWAHSCAAVQGRLVKFTIFLWCLSQIPNSTEYTYMLATLQNWPWFVSINMYPFSSDFVNSASDARLTSDKFKTLVSGLVDSVDMMKWIWARGDDHDTCDDQFLSHRKGIGQIGVINIYSVEVYESRGKITFPSVQFTITGIQI